VPVDDPSDLVAEQRRIKKDIERLKAGRGADPGDSGHAGVGADSIALGNDAASSGDRGVAVGFHSLAASQSGTAVGDSTLAGGWNSTAIGEDAVANGDGSTSLGSNADASGEDSVALGQGAYAAYDYSAAIGPGAESTASDQIMLGHSGNTVVVPGTFSNPSARHLKDNIAPAPAAPDVFPKLVEYEYKTAPGVRRVGHIADDLIGTDAERFVVLDDDGKPAGIAYQDLHTAQITALLARIEALENMIGGSRG
jgi:hypothetical protein